MTRAVLFVAAAVLLFATALALGSSLAWGFLFAGAMALDGGPYDDPTAH